MTQTLYGIPNCDTVKKARVWLDQNGRAFTFHDYKKAGIDRATLDDVVAEFLTELDSVGLAFPGGIEGALSMMDGHISHSAAQRLRRMSSTSSKIDPWERITALPPASPVSARKPGKNCFGKIAGLPRCIPCPIATIFPEWARKNARNADMLSRRSRG